MSRISKRLQTSLHKALLCKFIYVLTSLIGRTFTDFVAMIDKLLVSEEGARPSSLVDDSPISMTKQADITVYGQRVNERLMLSA